MATELLLHFEKENPEIPWGFRLIGGIDCNEALTVIKIFEGSAAENVGMKVGDVLIRINDVDAENLTHSEAHDVILDGNCNFTVKVRRNDNPDVDISTQEEVVHEKETCKQTEEFKENGEIKVKIECDLNITDEEIVQIIQGEQHEEQQQLIQQEQQANQEQTEFLQNSETLKILKEIEIKDDLVEDKRKWSTFLQKPDKPIRKAKPKEKPVEIKEPSYQVVIKKQKRRSFESAIALLEQEEALLGGDEGSVQSPDEIYELSKFKKQNGQTRLEVTDDYVIEYVEENIEEETGEREQINLSSIERSESFRANEEVEEEEERTVVIEEEVNEEADDKSVEINQTKTRIENSNFSKKNTHKKQHKTEASLSIEEQLAQVQEQLLALSRLPSTIQSTLNAVTRQLEKIASAAQLAEEEEEERNNSYEATTTTEDEITEQNTDGVLSTVMEEANEADTVKDDNTIPSQQSSENNEERVNTIDENEEENKDDIKEEVHGKEEQVNEVNVEEEVDDGLTPEERENLRKEQELEEKKKKELQILEEQCQRRLEQRPTMPLTPLERPIILPGGRKWCEPDDACPQPRHRKMSDDSINKTIETYSEVLVGRTKGESNCYLVPSKVLQRKHINFLKYQPPPKNLDHLQKSEVYKMIHDMDPPPKGICTRTEKILAVEDYQ